MSEPTAKMTVTLPLEVEASYSDLQEWQISEIRKGLEEAEAGELASDEEVREVFSKRVFGIA